MRLNVFPVLMMVAAVSGFAACGGSSGTGSAGGQNGGGDQGGQTGNGVQPGGGDQDAGATVDAAPPVDHGQPSTTYPAFKPEMPQLMSNGGPSLKTPKIVVVTWPNDPLADQLEQFSDVIGASKYWSAITSEYGVGAAIGKNHVRMKDAAPATMSDQDVSNYVLNNATNYQTAGWPAPDDQTIYMMFLHPSTSLNIQGAGDACSAGVGGYHDNVSVNGANVAYAVVPRCQFNAASLLDEATESASHELAEAALDPFPSANPGFVGFDDNHFAFEMFQQFQSENGDACEFYKEAFYKESEIGFSVQRQWSNKSAAAGHHPCVPVPAGAYFNTTPLQLETITATVQGQKLTSKGVHVALNETKTFPIGFYSDADTGGAWDISVFESNPILGAPKTARLKVSVDKTSGQNGEKAMVTVTVSSLSKSGLNYVTVVSSKSGVKHYMPVLIGSN